MTGGEPLIVFEAIKDSLRLLRENSISISINTNAALVTEEIAEFMEIINRIAQDHPILVDKYLVGKEIEVDAICDGENILIPGIMEHIERAGVHSGDSMAVYPAWNVSDELIERIIDWTTFFRRNICFIFRFVGFSAVNGVCFQKYVSLGIYI